MVTSSLGQPRSQFGKVELEFNVGRRPIPMHTALHIVASVAVPILWGTVVHLLFHHGVTKRRAMNVRDEQPERRS